MAATSAAFGGAILQLILSSMNEFEIVDLFEIMYLVDSYGRDSPTPTLGLTRLQVSCT